MTGSLQKKGKYYYAVLNFYDSSGKRVPKWISTKCEVSKNTKRKAQEVLNQLLVEYTGHEVLGVSKSMKVSEFAWFWLESIRPSIEASTYDSYFSNVQHIEQFFGQEEYKDLFVEQLTCEIIREFYAFLLREGKMTRRRDDSDPGLSRKYVREIAKNFKRMLDYAGEQDIVFIKKKENPNPARLVEVPQKPEKIKEYAYLDEEDTAVLFKAIKGHVLEPYFIISYFYGLRRSEALGLMWKSVNLKKRVLVINHTVVNNRRRIEKDGTMNQASHREYPIPDFIYAILCYLKKEQEENRTLFGSEYIESGYVFTWADGRPFSTDYPTKAFKKIVRKTEGLDENLRLHDLRASCVTMLARDGYTLKEVQDWIGHAENSEETLKVYMRVKNNTKSRIGATMGEKFDSLASEEQLTEQCQLPSWISPGFTQK